MVEVTEPAQRIWKPKSKEQEQFLRVPLSVFEAFFGGCVGVGKSEIITLIPIIFGLYKYRKFKGLIMRRTMPELESEIIQRAREYYPQTGAIFRTTRSSTYYEWPEFNSRVRFGHAQHEKDIRNYDTDEYQYYGPDELTSYTDFMYRYIAASRLRSTIPGLPAFVRTGGTPGNVGHGWVRKRFVEPCKEGGKILVDKNGNKKIFIKGTPNLELYKDSDPTYFNRLKILPEAEYRAKMGDWWTFSGQVFDNWRIEPYRDEPLNAQHVIPPFEIPSWWPKIIAVDIGYQVYILWGAISPDERLYVYREKLFSKSNVYEYGGYIGEASSNDGKILDFPVDHTAFDNSRGEDNSIATLLAKYSGLTPRPADKGKGSRVVGKSLLQDMMRWDSLSSDGASLPKLQVFDTCPLLVECIPLCVYDKKDGIEVDDIAEFVGDEPIDTLRYLARAYVRYAKDSTGQFQQFAKTAHIVRELETSGDMTKFYRQMEHLEKASKFKYGRRRSFRGSLMRRRIS